MSKIKNIFEWIARVGLSVLLVVFLFAAPFTLMPNLLKAHSNPNIADEYNFQGVLELWHIETFEGGSASRLSFLQKQALAFEKQNKGIFIIVTKIDVEQLNLNLQNGKLPNMISFGIGVGEQIAKHLVPLNFETKVRQDVLLGGRWNNTQLALPFMLGGYALVKNNDCKNINVGTGLVGSNNSLKCLQQNNKKILLEKNLNVDSYNAYDKFVKNNFGTLLGTQRDVFRVVNRIEKALMQNVEFDFLGGYTDLVQYVGVIKTNAKQEELCKKFAKNLVEERMQQTLQKYNLFSVLQNVKLYTSSQFEQMEQVLSKPLIVENVFLSQQKLQDEKQKSKLWVENEQRI